MLSIEKICKGKFKEEYPVYIFKKSSVMSDDLRNGTFEFKKFIIDRKNEVVCDTMINIGRNSENYINGVIVQLYASDVEIIKRLLKRLGIFMMENVARDEGYNIYLQKDINKEIGVSIIAELDISVNNSNIHIVEEE